MIKNTSNGRNLLDFWRQVAQYHGLSRRDLRISRAHTIFASFLADDAASPLPGVGAGLIKPIEQGLDSGSSGLFNDAKVSYAHHRLTHAGHCVLTVAPPQSPGLCV